MRIHARTFVKLPVDQMSLSLFLTVCHKAIKITDSYNLFQEVSKSKFTYSILKLYCMERLHLVNFTNNHL